MWLVESSFITRKPSPSRGTTAYSGPLPGQHVGMEIGGELEEVGRGEHQRVQAQRVHQVIHLLAAVPPDGSSQSGHVDTGSGEGYGYSGIANHGRQMNNPELSISVYSYRRSLSMDWNLDHIAWARRLKLRHLEIFLTLASAGSVTAAARLMHMTQPAVSHWLSDIEDPGGHAAVPAQPGTAFDRGRRVLARHAPHAGRSAAHQRGNRVREIRHRRPAARGHRAVGLGCAAAARHRGLAARVPRHLRGSG